MSDSTPVSHADFRNFLGQLVGLPAWRSRAGSGTGSVFTLEFGAALPEDATQGEFSLMVYCAWRIAERNKIVLSWHDDADQVIALGLAALEGLLVTEVTLSDWSDLLLGFGGDRFMHILNDFSPHQDFDTSWFLSQQGQEHYSVNPNNSLEFWRKTPS